MKVYYNGTIYKSNYSKIDERFKLDYQFNCAHKNKIITNRFHLNDEEFKYFKSNIIKYDGHKKGILDENINRMLDQVDFSLRYYTNQSIIYEIVEDKEGNKYAKEIITGLIFPLGKYYDRTYFYTMSIDEIIKKVTYTNNNLARFGTIVKQDSVASINEIDTYVKENSSNAYVKHFKSSIKSLYNENVFNKEIILKEKEELEKQDDATILMEDIEYILNLLKVKNIELYNKYYNEYQKLYVGKNTNNIYIPKKRDFSNLLSKIKLSLLINDSKCNNITEFLDIAIENYFNKLISNEKTETNINLIDIENFTDIFFKGKDNYVIIEQRDIIKKISLLYIFTIKDNINNIDSSNLENSYFKEIIKSIILNINELSENNVIDSVSLDFSKIYSLEETFNIIKSINFKEKDIKKLINYQFF